MKTCEEAIALVRNKIRLRQFAYSTEQSYCGWIARYYHFCRNLKPGLTQEQRAEAYLTDIAVRQRLSAKTQNQALAALLFLYGNVLGRPLAEIDALRAKKPIRERTAPSREQIRTFRNAIEDTPHTPAKLLVDLLYGCGLRVTEPLNLRIKDILWDEGPNGHFVVRAAKGGKDRRVPIPSSCVEPIKRQIDKARLLWELDRKLHPSVGVSLPHQLGKKYAYAAFAWQWFWIFPAPGHCDDPYSSKRVRYHLLHDAVQRVVFKTARNMGLEGLITPHVLRHAYATHSREGIEVLQKLMGHVSIDTTAGYRHATVDRATNPLDDMVRIADA